MHNLQ